MAPAGTGCGGREQRSQERLEQTADRTVAAMRGILSLPEERLGGLGPVFMLTENRSTSSAGAAVVFPVPSTAPEATTAPFSRAAKRWNFEQGQPEAAADWYRRLIPDPSRGDSRGRTDAPGACSAEVGRVSATAGSVCSVAAIDGVSVAGAPAELVGRTAWYELSGQGADALKQDLLSGRWPLSHGQFDFYWSAVAVRRPRQVCRRNWRKQPCLPGKNDRACRRTDMRRYGPMGARGFILWRGTAERG